MALCSRSYILAGKADKQLPKATCDLRTRKGFLKWRSAVSNDFSYPYGYLICLKFMVRILKAEVPDETYWKALLLLLCPPAYFKTKELTTHVHCYLSPLRTTPPICFLTYYDATSLDLQEPLLLSHPPPTLK